MKICTGFDKGTDHVRLVIKRNPDADDAKLQVAGKPLIGRESVFLDTDPSFDPSQTHNDLLALVCLLTVEPFSAKKIELDFPVTKGFAEIFQKNFGKEISPTSATLAPRKTGPNFVDALCFSGGVDSCAALHLLPDNAISFFLKMEHPDNGVTGKYRPDAALHSCKAVEESGRKMIICPSSIEYGRKPTGFAVDWTPSVAAILHADLFKLRSVSFGMILESAFRLGSKAYAKLSPRKGYRVWAKLFDHCAIPIALPTAGISEVLTSRIAQGPAAKWNPQSCVRGDVGLPCMTCYKCFRKTMLDCALAQSNLPDEHYDLFYKDKTIRTHILKVPIHHEIVMAHSLNLLPESQNPVYRGLHKKLTPTIAYDLNFLERFYPEGLKLLPDFLQISVEDKLRALFPAMSQSDCTKVEAWNMDSLLEDPEYKAGQDELNTLAKSAGH